MSNLRKTLDNQQKINEAVKNIIDYFTVNEDYTGHLEQMLNAQTQILGLMQIAKKQLAADRDCELFCQSDEIFYFMHYANDHLMLLKPFVELAESINDKDG